MQRVSNASVAVERETVGSIGHGLLVLLGVSRTDTETDANAMAQKIAGLRIFSDDEGHINLSVKDVGGAVLVVSQFTLYAETAKGRRPSFTAAAAGDQAEPLVEAFVAALDDQGVPIAQGRFGAKMAVALVNDGPVTIILETDEGRLV